MADPLPLQALHHVSIQVTDVPQSVAFYRDVLGFQELQRPNMRFPGAWLIHAGVQLHLIGGQPDFAAEPGEEIRSTDDHLAFHTDQMQRVEEMLQTREIGYRVNIQGGSGLRQIFFHDPDGRTIEVAEYPPHPGSLDAE